jgi:hypothetical protein
MVHIHIAEHLYPEGEAGRIDLNNLQRAAQVTLEYLHPQEQVDCSIVITGDAGIQDYNRQYRQIDKPTDVLSFPSGEVDPAARRRSSPVREPPIGCGTAAAGRARRAAPGRLRPCAERSASQNDRRPIRNPRPVRSAHRPPANVNFTKLEETATSGGFVSRNEVKHPLLGSDTNQGKIIVNRRCFSGGANLPIH